MGLSLIIRIALAGLLLQGCSHGKGQASRPVSLDQVPRLRGMTFAHEGYNGDNGYGGSTVGPSLDSLARLNVDALAIVPYTFMRDPRIPSQLPVPTRRGQETDAAVARAVAAAHARGWFVLLKPQIWIGGGHWPGDVDFDAVADWETFFHNYEAWIMHYARFSEEHGIEALCIGTELVQTTLKYPDKWRALIRKLRGVYGGQLTYAANWGEEFENLAFWAELDVMGLNSYYPLSKRDHPTDAELLEGARSWMRMANDKSHREDKPLWLTEVGYRSVDLAWQNPHAHGNGRAPDQRCQERCFAALTAAAAESDRLTGMFIWKWPSYLGREGGRRDPGTGFTPGGKLAARPVTDFYGNWGITK